MVSDGQSGPPVQPELRWVKVTGPDALRPLDRHWVRYVRLALLLAAVLIAWRILAWQEDGYRAAAYEAGSAQLSTAIAHVESFSTPTPEAGQVRVPIVVLSPTPTPTPTPEPTPTPTPDPTPATHQVRPGETLSGIAALYEVSIEAIVELNNITNRDNLAAGLRLRLPEGTEVPEQTDAPGPYTVQPGDTLSAIAVQFGVTIDVLMAANSLEDPDNIYIGQELRIPGRSG